MHIQCPQCQFERQVADSRISPTTHYATCPKCGTRFSLKDDECVAHFEQLHDDPLPPGAVIPPSLSEMPSAEPSVPTQASAEQKKAEAELPDIPWLHIRRYGFFPALYLTIVRVMFAAPRFFSLIQSGIPATSTVSFFLLIGMFRTFVEQWWALAFFETLAAQSTDIQAQEAIEAMLANPEWGFLLVITPFMLLVQLLFTTTFARMMLQFIAPENADFERIFHVMALSAAPSILCIIPLVGSLTAMVWSIACSFVGCRYALRLSWAQTTLALAPLYGLIFAFSLYVLQSRMQSFV